MPPSLKSNIQIWRLAADLRLNRDADPVASIVAFCRKRVRAIQREFGSQTLGDLLSAVAARVDTLFIEVHTDADVARVSAEYARRGEVIFVTLAEQLAPNVYAITFRLTRPTEVDRQYVSVIDCRGEKGWRAYFSKWHELAHLLTLTEQGRLKFCRTHAEPEIKDPEEALMDVIAGEVGFLSDLVLPHTGGEISFDKIAELRERLCSEASQQASLIGFVKAWPAPALLVHARLGLRAAQRRAQAQRLLGFHDAPEPVLRAVHVTQNSAADQTGFSIPRNMRVPPRSIIHSVSPGSKAVAAIEDLGWWESQGRSLDSRQIKVIARPGYGGVDALIIPLRR
jgi:hypothetical protein